ncbi:tRNA-specific adenosine deaminase [Legionella parisiensis]|uniref:Guanine deaminase n=2 Tax=Legionella parisiensis TaxID=45071 RepID=A0A1E5JKV1_9GAMM|nr:tRNA-specific adenosine deaminase [Legionella parisiensis]OEH45132.1 Guanine deaminase [Legionella parisiensis]STX77866.1 tRNA-specific adenosine deaminase [Legionella parisiensis]
MCNHKEKIMLQRYLIVFFLAVLSCQVFAADMPEEHQNFLNKTFQLAQLARQKGNHPFGALLVYRGRVILTAENLVISSHDVTAHAEMVLIRQASKQFSEDILKNAILYTSTEPCAMCSGAIYWAGISRVVYGCSTQTLEKHAYGGLAIPSAEIFKQGKRMVRASGPYFEAKAVKVHEGFWRPLI